MQLLDAGRLKITNPRTTQARARSGEVGTSVMPWRAVTGKSDYVKDQVPSCEMLLVCLVIQGRPDCGLRGLGDHGCAVEGLPPQGSSPASLRGYAVVLTGEVSACRGWVTVPSIGRARRVLPEELLGRELYLPRPGESMFPPSFKDCPGCPVPAALLGGRVAR